MRNQMLLGAFLIVISQLAFTIMDASIKWLSTEISTATIFLFRNIIMLCWIAPYFLRSSELKNSIQRLPLHAVRSFAGQIGMIFVYISFTVLPFADAVILRSFSPLFIPVIAAIWLKEKLPWILAPSLCLTMVGTWILIDVDKPQLSFWSLLPIIGGIFSALSMVAIKRLSRIAQNDEIIFYFGMTGVIFAILFGLFTEFTWPDEPSIWLIVGLLGLSGSLGQLWLTKANHCLNASILAPFYYLNMVFGAILSHFFWDEKLGIWGWLGSAIIICAGLLLTYQQRRH